MSWPPEQLASVSSQVRELLEDALRLERELADLIARAPPERSASARNLVHYLALRRRDLRSLQHQLADLGLSSLGRAESHVLSNLTSVLEVLGTLSGAPVPPASAAGHPSRESGQAILAARTHALLGPPANSSRSVRIMVTMPSEAAADPGLIHALVEHGMECLRINCAHDDPAAWGRMLDALERAKRATGKPCKALMDLAGPKLRTGAVEPGPRVTSWKPHWNELGQLEEPARLWLTPDQEPELPPLEADTVLPLDGAWLSTLEEGDRIKLVDLRGKSRTITVGGAAGRSRWATSTQLAFIDAGIPFKLHPARQERQLDERAATTRPTLPPLSQALVLRTDDVLILTRDPTPGRPVTRSPDGRLSAPAVIPCTLPEIFTDVRPGESIWFDDGKIAGIIVETSPSAMKVRILNAPAPGKKLRADKGINLPESHLSLPALTPKDLLDLDFIAERADVVGLSFVHRPQDIEDLQAEILKRTRRPLGIVLKIETRRAFANLPWLLLTSLASDPVGVMIARGDLAVECGYERLAEVQEEILWLCEAAHVPAIWATQVLETLNKKGQPSRAEITDAAMGERAECVMLNKGPHILEAVRVLDDILTRMRLHQEKKVALLRALSVSAGTTRRPPQAGPGQ